MRKKFIQALVGLAMVLGLILSPIATGPMARRAGREFTPAGVLAMGIITGWDDGGSSGC
jgi:hypothetical protein